MPYYPICFSIPESKIVPACPTKKKFKAGIVAGDRSTYVFDREEDYYQDYRDSYFAVTKHKGGWDCLRHYEILGNGCIPYFENLENMPTTTMTLFPKDIVLETNRLYEEMVMDPEKQADESFLQRCRVSIEGLLFHTRTYLSSAAIANYVLSRSGHSHVTSILFLSGDTYQDYLRCLVLGAFKTKFQTDCHDYPIIKHIYNDFTGHGDMGTCKGFTFTNIVPRSYHDDSRDHTVTEDIVGRRYDLVVYGSLHRGLPFHDLVTAFYLPTEIIYLCGEDICRHVVCDSCIAKEKIDKRQSHIFVRELYSLQYYLVHGKDGARCRTMIDELRKGGFDLFQVKWMTEPVSDAVRRHRQCLQDIVEKNQDFGVVMEDSVHFESNVHNNVGMYIQILNQDHAGWDIMFPDYHHVRNVTSRCPGEPVSTEFYIITRKCALKLYRLCDGGGDGSSSWLESLMDRLHVQSYKTV